MQSGMKWGWRQIFAVAGADWWSGVNPVPKQISTRQYSIETNANGNHFLNAVVTSSCVCLSACLSQVGVLLKRLNVGSPQHDSPWTTVSWRQRSWQNSNGVTLNLGAKCRWGRWKLGHFRQITRYNSKTSIVAGVVNLVQSQVCHSERPPLFAAHLPWYSASRKFVSNGWRLFCCVYLPLRVYCILLVIICAFLFVIICKILKF